MILRSLFAAALLVLPALPAQAQQSGALCSDTYATCQRSCTRQYGGDPAGNSGCVARCTTDRAACDAAAGYHAAKPWMKEQVDRVWRFIDGFMGPGDKTSPPQPDQRDQNQNETNHQGEDT